MNVSRCIKWKEWGICGRVYFSILLLGGPIGSVGN